jgi:hypothetical protein
MICRAVSKNGNQEKAGRSRSDWEDILNKYYGSYYDEIWNVKASGMRGFYGCCVGSSLNYEICIIGYLYRLHNFQGKLKRLICSSELRLLLYFRI